MARTAVAGSLEWARFEDWLSGEFGVLKDWTVIAQHSELVLSSNQEFTEEISTTSFLCPKKAVTEIFRCPHRVIAEIRESIFVDSTAKTPKITDNSLKKSWKTIITRREAYGDAYPESWRLYPEIEDFFNLRMIQQGSLVDPQTGDEVVRIPFPATKGPVVVRTDYLREFLAAWKKVLVRQHEIKRNWIDPIADLPEHEGSDRDLVITQRGVYLLQIRNNQENEYLRDSWLLAKDLVPPFASAGKIGRYRRNVVLIKHCPEFIIDRSADGSPIMRKPNPNDFTPVYFDARVLKRYYDEPSRYHVGFHAPGMGAVGQIDSWGISVGRNEDGFIVAWLADLVKQRLPEEEIRHWRTHNISPQGGMAMDFFNAEMMCNPSKVPSLESKLRDCRYHIRGFFLGQGKEVFRPYAGPDIHVEDSLRIPLINEHGEFRECMTCLCKMFIECLNEDLFKSELPKPLIRDAEGKGLGGIKLFVNWLTCVWHVDKETVRGVQDSLQNVQMIRSKAGIAHRFSDSAYRKLLERKNLPQGATAIQVFSSVAEPLADSLEELCSELGVGPDLWWRKKETPNT